MMAFYLYQDTKDACLNLLAFVSIIWPARALETGGDKHEQAGTLHDQAASRKVPDKMQATFPPPGALPSINLARKLMDEVRRRKGLHVEDRVVQSATKQRTLGRKK